LSAGEADTRSVAVVDARAIGDGGIGNGLPEARPGSGVEGGIEHVRAGVEHVDLRCATVDADIDAEAIGRPGRNILQRNGDRLRLGVRAEGRSCQQRQRGHGQRREGRLDRQQPHLRQCPQHDVGDLLSGQ
jgi:hypothetical protein